MLEEQKLEYRGKHFTLPDLSASGVSITPSLSQAKLPPLETDLLKGQPLPAAPKSIAIRLRS